MGELNSGDKFLLDETTYTAGSELKLTDSSGSTVYADLMI